MVRFVSSSLPIGHANISLDSEGTVLNGKPLQTQGECAYLFLSPSAAYDREREI